MAYTQKRQGSFVEKCYFCENKIKHINYKEVELLKRNLSDYGRITPRYVNGNCSKHQRMIAKAVKLARFMALLPYVGVVHSEE